MSRNTPGLETLSQEIDAILADGNWHTRAEFVERLEGSISPEIAARRYNVQTKTARNPAHTSMIYQGRVIIITQRLNEQIRKCKVEKLGSGSGARYRKTRIDRILVSNKKEEEEKPEPKPAEKEEKKKKKAPSKPANTPCIQEDPHAVSVRLYNSVRGKARQQQLTLRIPNATCGWAVLSGDKVVYSAQSLDVMSGYLDGRADAQS